MSVDVASDGAGGPIGHVPVLMAETLAALSPAAGEIALDCTAGRGGHAEALGAAVGPGGAVVVNDADESNASFAAARVEKLSDAPRVERLVGSFVAAPRGLVTLGLRADVVLADLGFSSNQMDDGERGLSFRRDGPLDMRYDRRRGRSAASLVNESSEEELREVIRTFGEEPGARRIASKIVAAREEGPIETTGRLASIVRGAVGGPRGGARGKRIDPATRTFQAIRIAVNDELGALGALLEAVERDVSIAATERSWLADGARVGVISFHSLEDRMVKRTFQALGKRGVAEVLGDWSAGADEVSRNPRARSARLRALRVTRLAARG